MTKKNSPETLVREKQILAKYVPVHRATWWRWIKAGKAPKPVKLGQSISAWRLSEIEAWQRGEWSHPENQPSPA